jgi:ABC-type antimicrobial peptide transport system permease subunit
MRLNSLRLAFRSLLRNKVITSINILGLSIGISAALVIYLIIQYDYGFDRYEPNRDRIYRVTTHGINWDNAGVPVPLPRALAGITGIERSAFEMGMNDNGTKVSISQGNGKEPKVFKEQENFVYSDGNYFSLFPHQWLAGSPDVSLKDPHQLVLSESLVRRYFAGMTSDQVIGKTITVDDSILMVVSGVVKDLTVSTDFDWKAFLSLGTITASQGLKDLYQWDEWGSTNSVNQVMLVLSPGVKPANVAQQVQRLFKAREDKSQYKTTITLQPMSDIHFNETLEGKVSKSTLLSLSLIAVFILLLGSINFINLSTAQASERAKEIGMRKILGSSKQQLIARYLSETALLTAIAAVLSLVIIPLIIKLFSDFMPEGLDAGRILQPHVLVFLVILIIVVSFLSGIYPALVLTHIKPLSVTRNTTLSTAGGNRRIWLRKTLTVSQFVIAQVFIIGVLVVNSQIHFATNKEMGFRKEAIINFYVPFDWAHPDGRKYVLRDKLKGIPELQEVSLGNAPPAMGGFMTTQVEFKEVKKDIRLPVDTRNGDTSFIGLYHIRLVAGRNVLPADSPVQYLINETLARDLGFQHPGDAVGHMMNEGNPIAGVMADFHLASVRTPIHPMVFTYDSKWGYVMHVALHPSPDTWQRAIGKMQKAWEQIYPEQPFKYTFLDKSIAQFYESEGRLSRLLTWAAGVAILISCLGLLGLVIFTANQRTKEIGIRKVLGASVAQIIALLSKDFVRLVALAFLIAVPIAWYGANQWLQSFAYHTGLQWWLFIIAGAAMLVSTLLILGIRAGKAALSNPVNSLRTE